MTERCPRAKHSQAALPPPSRRQPGRRLPNLAAADARLGISTVGGASRNYAHLVDISVVGKGLAVAVKSPMPPCLPVHTDLVNSAVCSPHRHRGFTRLGAMSHKRTGD